MVASLSRISNVQSMLQSIVPLTAGHIATVDCLFGAYIAALIYRWIICTAQAGCCGMDIGLLRRLTLVSCSKDSS